ncbi:MAG: aldose 1-epimerase family protein [Lachnospiraceae bacterium]
MRHILENELLHVEIDTFGAEIKSVKNRETGMEYMWQGDKKYWGRTSPVLFPFVGSLKNKEYIYNGKSYPMGQHGFARDMEHEMVSKTGDEIWFCLRSNEETMAKYPFKFELCIGYKLTGNSVKVMWKVVNTGDKQMYFSIGAHPAFNCPVGNDTDKCGYGIYFDGKNEIHHHGNDVATGMALREDIVLKLENNVAKITQEFFDRCTYMVEGNQTGEVGLVDKQGKMYVSVIFDTPLFAIWSPEGKNAPFVCIEPWYGRCDAEDFNGELKDREYTNTLGAGEIFERSYCMKFMY